MTTEVPFEEVIHELRNTDPGRVQLELATLRAIVAAQRREIEELRASDDC